MDAFRNVLLAALGAAAYSQDRLRDMVHGLIERGQLTREQGERLIEEWKTRGSEEQERVSERVSEEVRNLVARLPVVSREEFEKLEQRVELLEKRLEQE